MTVLATTLAMLLPAPGLALEPPPRPRLRPDRHTVVIPADPRVRVVRPYRPWLHRLAWCESTNRPYAVDPSGTYFGLYQFDLRTWFSVGGRGMPHRAGRLEQSYRAVRLRQARGTSPWPVCG